MARIPILTPETMSREQLAVHDAVVSGPRKVVQGPLMAALHRPELADKWQKLGELLRYRTCLPMHLNELAILVTARHRDSQLEWHLHEPFAREAGLEEEIIEAVRARRRPAGAAPEVLDIHDFALQLHTLTRVEADVYERIKVRWGVVGVVELTAVIGYYTMVAMTLNAHEFPLPGEASPPFAVGQQ